MLAVKIERGRPQFLPEALDKVGDLALGHGRDDEEARARVEARLAPDERQAEVECWVVEELARAEEDDGELDAALEGRASAVDNLAHEVDVGCAFLVLAVFRGERGAWRGLVEAEDEDKDTRDEFAVLADPDGGDEAVRVQGGRRREWGDGRVEGGCG